MAGKASSLAGCFWLVSLTVAGLAQTDAGRPEGVEELAADRPGFTEPPTVLRRGVLQLESGFAFARDRSPDGSRTGAIVGGSPLLRLGVGGQTEIRFGGDGFLAESETTPGARWSRGLSDFAIGFKHGLAPEKGKIPAIAVLAFLSLPTGESQFTTSGYDPTVKLIWSKSLPGDFDLGGNFNFSSLTDDSSRWFQSVASVSLGRPLLGRWNGYWEVYTERPAGRGGNAAWVFDTGVAYLLGRDMQIDCSIGRTLAGPVSGWFVAAGFVVRSPFGLGGRR